jgi:hypothetical protein
MSWDSTQRCTAGVKAPPSNSAQRAEQYSWEAKAWKYRLEQPMQDLMGLGFFGTVPSACFGAPFLTRVMAEELPLTSRAYPNGILGLELLPEVRFNRSETHGSDDF